MVMQHGTCWKKHKTNHTFTGSLELGHPLNFDNIIAFVIESHVDQMNATFMLKTIL